MFRNIILKISIALALLTFVSNASAQYAPQHPLPGNDAIHFSDTSIKSWITSATLQRGWQNIQDTTLGYASNGDSTSVVGTYNNNVVSLGDGGSITLFFKNGIKNGPGVDFAVFENGIVNILDSALAFLELAFVEVSTNGTDFVRFPATSNTQDTVQITNPDYLNASELNNFAGKYRAGYGTPFDLEELVSNTLINTDSIYYVKLIDVIGSIEDTIANRDKNGKKINDPFPTPFFSCGFDLNSIGVINPLVLDSTPNTISLIEQVHFKVYPNPASNYLFIKDNALQAADHYTIINALGKIMAQKKYGLDEKIPLEHMPQGKYTIVLSNKNKILGYGHFIKE